MEEYMELVFEEYKKTVDLNMIKQKHLVKYFYRWLEENKRMLAFYEKFIESVGFVPGKMTVELDKTSSDSVLTSLPINSKGIIVSKYVKDTKKIKDNVAQTKGKIVKEGKTLYLLYGHNKKIELNSIRNVVTQLPILDNTKEEIIDAIECNKNVIIGTFGHLGDLNKEEKIKKLYELKNELEIYTSKNIIGEYSESDRYYAACITPKILYNEKNHKTLWKN